MLGNKRDIEELKERIEKLETQMAYLFRNLGITSSEPPEAKASQEVLELAKSGKMIEAIKAFREETGASLKDAKIFIESLEKGK